MDNQNYQPQTGYQPQPNYQPQPQPEYQPQSQTGYQPQPQPGYQPQAQQYPMQQPQAAMPVAQLKTNRGLVKLILLSIITLGIYALVVMSGVSADINIIASRYDGKKTMHFLLMALVLAPITLSIYAIVWWHQLSARIGNELQRRGIDYKFGAADFWLWNVLGALIIVGPFIYMGKLFKAMNLLSADFNQRG
ncbi:MAG: DUF4234 domain-containing protein [Eubacterium sp.]|nr:DUF4234 domain-containing protein [Eubacterium sp.]